MKRFIEAVSDTIKGKAPLLNHRSAQWPTHRKHWLTLNSECAACGSKDSLQVHHVVPFHEDKSKELDYTNYITLCESAGGRECHLNIGHKGSFKQANLAVRQDAAELRKSLNLPELKETVPT